MGNGFSKDTLKVKSKMGSARLQTHISKKETALMKAKREIAELLNQGKDQSARIKVEGVIREEQLVRVYEWLILMCDLINARVKQIETSKDCPDDLCETACSLMYCAKRLDDIGELTEICRQFRGKWGSKWMEANMENRSGRVSKKIIDALDPTPPSRDVVVDKLKEIAIANGVVFDPVASPIMDEDVGGDEAMPGLVGHLNEYTVEFDSKPFGMEWTATDDELNLWVSNIIKDSVADRGGVVLGSMLVALNGKDVRNLGAGTIHRKCAALSLPIRITFRKPVTDGAPSAAGSSSPGPGGGPAPEMKVDVAKVNEAVSVLKDPINWPLNHDERLKKAKELGCNQAEAASSVFLAEYMIEQAATAAMAARTAHAMGVVPADPATAAVMGGAAAAAVAAPGMGYAAPMDTGVVMASAASAAAIPSTGAIPSSGGDGDYGSVPTAGAYIGDVGSSTDAAPAAFSTAEEPPKESGGGGDDLDDLEARFAALRGL